MKTKEEMKSGSKWRRSLMALAILSAPVVSIAGFSGTASAAVFDTDHKAEEKCDGTDLGINVFIATPVTTPLTKFEIKINGTKVTTADVEPSALGNSYFYARADGTYTVRINQTNGFTPSTRPFWEGSVTVDCDRAATDTFTVDPICEGTPKGISVTLTSRYDDKSPYDLSVSYPGGSTPASMSFADTDFDEVLPSTTPETYTATKEFLYGGEGNYVVSIVHRVTGKTVKYQGTLQTVTYDPECPSTSSSSVPGYNFNFTFKLPTTTPVLPSTGSDSSTLLLVIAPVMVLLGAGLIMARRRLATV